MRSLLSHLVLVAVLLMPVAGFAQGSAGARDDGPTLLAYGLRGFWTGAELGLAIGYLATGTHYESREWRKLVLGTGIGAIAGVGAGISLALVDSSSQRAPTGWFVLRDMGYGATLGALTGMAIGALFLVDSGRPKDLLTGAAIGTLGGAAVGLAFGLVQGMNAPGRSQGRARDWRGVRLTLVAMPSNGPIPAVAPGLVGRF